MTHDELYSFYNQVGYEVHMYILFFFCYKVYFHLLVDDTLKELVYELIKFSLAIHFV